MNTILITGASGNLGQALAKIYANKNTRLILTGRNAEKLTEISTVCEKKGAKVIAAALDICDQESFMAWIKKIDEQYPVDIVIANAGTNSALAAAETDMVEVTDDADIPELAVENFQTTKKVFDTNTYGVLATITPLIERMKKQKNGQIAIISSLAAYRGLPRSAAYCASKAALKVYGEALRAYLAVHKIKVNVVFPGFVQSAMSDTIKTPKPFMISADKAAKIIKKGLAKNKARIAFPLMLSLPVWLSTLLPNRFIDFLLARAHQRQLIFDE